MHKIFPANLKSINQVSAADSAVGPGWVSFRAPVPLQDGFGGMKSESGSRTRIAHSVYSAVGIGFLPAPTPSLCAEERKARRIRARACLSAASLHETPAGLCTAGCSWHSEESQTVGSPFLLLTWLLAKQKKREEPPGYPRPVNVKDTQTMHKLKKPSPDIAANLIACNASI